MRPPRSRVALLGTALCVLLLLAGCGSKSKSSYPSLGSQGTPETAPEGGGPPGWQAISGNRFAAGSTVATVTVVTTNPRALRLQVNASPDVDTKTSYEVQCDRGSTAGPSTQGTTPLTRDIAIPASASGGKGDVECSVTANATKPASASMTIVVLQRLAAQVHR